jgi:hypothetical protein
MSQRPRLAMSASAVVVLVGSWVLGAGGCDSAAPLRPVNRDPIAHSLVAFPTTIAMGDSSIVVCIATDPDGDTLVYDWSSDCRMVKKGAILPGDLTLFNQRAPSLVVYPGACNRTPLDSGWVRCEVRDLRGVLADAGLVRIIVRQ